MNFIVKKMADFYRLLIFQQRIFDVLLLKLYYCREKNGQRHSTAKCPHFLEHRAVFF